MIRLMLAADRHRRIVDIVNSEQSIRVSELSELFSVTEETIRRDLFRLESEGKLVRTHGGAVSIAVHDKPLETPYFEREIARIEEKRVIAAKAVELVHPGDRIALDASTTAWQMARLLPDVPLTVVTNSVNVILELANKDNIDVVGIGGMFVKQSLSFVGPRAERSIGNYHVNKLFLSCRGVDIRYGISEATEAQGQIKARMLENSELAVLLADSTKFGKRGFSRFCTVSDIDTIITDDDLDDEVAQLFEPMLLRTSSVLAR